MFDQVLGRELARAHRGGEPVSVVLADVDRFKQLNDRLGHLAGDEALRRVAQTLAGHGRASDLVARFGGEEFAVVLPGTSVEAALVVAERMRVAISNTTAVTASFGVATYPAHGDDGEALISAADAALYSSKNTGRDRVTAAGNGVPDVSPRLNR
jgi:diguanylate cyclase (GGDEF)-like protein